jgi:CheY-like chemotaxis protein
MANSLQIIVVDDQPDLAESTGRLLRLFGHEVSVFNSAASVLDVLDEIMPDLIFSDIGMPEMDGFELAARIKRRPDCEKVILAALTGLGDEEYRQAAVAAGFDYRFVKPMQPDELRHFMDEIVKTRSSR